MLDRQRQVDELSRDALLLSAGEYVWGLMAPYRQVAEQMIAQHGYAEVLARQVPTFQTALLMALPSFLDDVRAAMPDDREERPRSSEQTTGGVQPSVATASSGAPRARALFILWLALVCIAAFITSGTIMEQIANRSDPFDGSGLEDLAGLTAVVYFAEKYLASPDDDANDDSGAT
jgi:hypothetical protein